MQQEHPEPENNHLRRVPIGPEAKAPKAKGYSFKAAFWQSKTRLWGSLGCIALLLIAFVSGISYYWSMGSEEPYQHVDVYVTDLPANFTRLELRLAGVFVGEANHSLKVQKPVFDLLSLQGPKDALLVASGDVPAGNYSDVRLQITAARAQLNGVYITLKVPATVLAVQHDFGLGQAGSALLFDIDVEKSVTVTAQGLVFNPIVKSVYVHPYGGDASKDPDFEHADRVDFQKEPAQEPRQQTVTKDDGLSKKKTGGATFKAPTSSSDFGWRPGGGVTTTPTTSDPPAETTDDPENTDTSDPPPVNIGGVTDPGDGGGFFGEEEGPTDTAHKWFIQFFDQVAYGVNSTTGVSIDEQVRIVEDAGATYIFGFGSVAAGYIEATQHQIDLLLEDPLVKSLEEDHGIELMLASTKTAIRIPELINPVTGLRDAQGRLLDGRGVGVAIIDTGIDGRHPDLPHKLIDPVNPLVLVNYKVESVFSVDVIDSDLTSGHGTHVGGIISGHGTEDPAQTGVAPGVKIYALSIGEVATTLWPNQALDWVNQNYNKVNPPIKLVSNSWGSGNAYDPNSLTTTLVNSLVSKGVTVVFSAGNGGGDGSIAATNSQCQIPTPGVICVGAYDDLNTGTRNGPIAPYSARGSITDPKSWPDVIAPGTNVRSTTTPFGYVTGIGLLDHYATLKGTSMSAPHVTGTLALVLQARPGLSPAQLESVIENSAYKMTNGGAYDPATGGHYAKGHGLLDAFAAVQLARSM